MTDLCYNCGGCHLPRPCSHGLQTCDTCENKGHTWNFCHLGPIPREPDYKYFALCHNCDKWHLPQPCERGPVQCLICHQKGHLQFFCPIKPLARDWHQWTDPAPAKRARSPGLGDTTQTSHHLMGMSQRAYNPVTSHSFTPEQLLHAPGMMAEVYSLKMTVVKDVLDLVKMHPAYNVHQYLSQAYAGHHRAQQQPMAPPQAIWASTAQGRLERPHGSNSTPQGFRQAITDYETPTRFTMGPRTTGSMPPYTASSDAHDEGGLDSRYKVETDQHSQVNFPNEAVGAGAPFLTPKSETAFGVSSQQSSNAQDVLYLPGSEALLRRTGTSGLPSIATAGIAAIPASPSQHGQGANTATNTKRGGKKSTGTRTPRKSAATKAKEKEEKEAKQKEENKAKESKERGVATS